MPPAPSPAITPAPLVSLAPSDLGISDMVLSAQCGKRQCGDCEEAIRCDCLCHRKPGLVLCA